MRDRGIGPWPWWVETALLVAVAGGLVWAVTTGDRESAAYLAMGAWVLVLCLALPRCTPAAPAWALALIAVGCAGAAVAFFRVYHWAGWPVMGWLDAVSTGAYSFVAVLLLLGRWLRGRGGPGEPPAAGGAAPDAELSSRGAQGD